jgi:hypothetical protein
MSKRQEEAVSENADRELNDADLDGTSGGFVIYGAEAKAPGTQCVFGDGSVRFVKASDPNGGG